MAKPTIKVKRDFENEIKKRNGNTIKQKVLEFKKDISESLDTIRFPSEFQSAFDVYSENLERTVRYPKTRKVAAQMAFDAKSLINYLNNFDSVIVTVGQDEDSDFKIAFQGMKINNNGTVELDTTKVLTNYKEDSASTFPVFGVPTP